MSEDLDAEPVLAHAKEQEKEYDWLGASQSYRRALGLVSEQDLARKGEICELLGHAFYSSARQCESNDQFRERIVEAAAHYGQATDCYVMLSEQGVAARTLRCRAMIAFMGFWLGSEAKEKREHLDVSWQLTKEALKSFHERGESLEFGKTYNLLSICPILGTLLEWNFQARERSVKETLESGEQAVKLLSNTGDFHELARAYAKTSNYLQLFLYYFVDLDQRETYLQKARNYWQKAYDISEEIALVEMANFPSIGYWAWGEGADLALTNFEKALEYGEKASDKFTTGFALDWLAAHTFWKLEATEDPDESRAMTRKALHYAEEAKKQFAAISFKSSRGWVLPVETPYTEYYYIVALFETDPRKRRELLERAKEVAPDELRRAEHSGYYELVSCAHHVLSKTLAALAKIETNPQEKKMILEEALSHRSLSTRLIQQFEPLQYWNQGVEQNYMSDIRSQLAQVAENAEDRKKLLDEAIFSKEECLRLCNRESVFFESTGTVHVFAWLGYRQSECGNLWNILYGLTERREDLRRTAESLLAAAESFRKLNLASRMAESHWRAAEAYDGLSEHLKASENFLLASNNYRIAAEKVPQLKAFYGDYASYMEAWSEIEKARHHHGREDYSSAREFYERASNLHRAAKEWRFLAPNYSAWAQLENGEDLSRREQGEEAIQTFEEAARLFSETKQVLQTELSKIENLDKKQLVGSLIRGADLRREYCVGRVALEEAKLLDRKGDHHSSSQKYAQAAETFENLTRAVETEQARSELRPIATLSRAWQMMTRAEADASPELYQQASRLFEEAKEQNPSEKARSLALGHSRFCRALEAGTKFADTGEVSLHDIAIQNLESAAKYYLKAGFDDASEYAEATELLFDVYLHMNEAKREKDHEKKAKLYSMTERVLQASVDSFLKAKHLAKRELALRLMEKVKKERELALSLTEVLRAPAFVSATAVFSAPSPTRERAIGLERFEHADVQARMITRQKSLKVGDDLDLEIELVNAGKGPAQLMKVEELVPEGFELTRKPEPYRVEDSYLNMKGRRLDPLKTEEVKLVLKPRLQGRFTLRPRILYLDESGNYKSHEPEPIEVTVKELGISGWLKGR